MEKKEKQIYTEDALTLLNGMFASVLPPLIDGLFSEKSVVNLMNAITDKKVSSLYKIDDTTKLISNLVNGIHSPKNIHGTKFAAESIKFYTLKIDESWRPLAIPNLNYAVMFAYNSLIVSREILNRLYDRNERLNGITKHSESPIIGRDGMISAILYEDLDDIGEISADKEPVGFIGYSELNSFFNESKLQRFKIESTYPYVLQLDLNRFFENIYTHVFDYSDNELLKYSVHNKVLENYLKWLDPFNQKINDNHTKGIIQGPISSKIAAELLQLSIDKKIEKMINDLEFDIQFTRFVDDYRFYAKKNSDLTEFRHHLTKIFRKYELSFNDTKSQIYKGFEIQKQARDDIFSKLKFLDNKNENLTFEKYLKLRDVIITLLDQNEISTIKSVLSILEKKITAKKITFTEDNIVTSFLRFLIKLAYVQPMLASRIYSVINEMLKVVVPKIRHEAWEVLFEELEYIELNYAETDLEFWFFFVLVNAGVSAETGRAFSLYKTLAKSNVNVIVLTIFIKEKSKKTNLKVYNELLKQMTDLSPKDKSEFLGTIGQSKWWILLTKMWLVMENEITDSEIIDLFKTKKNQIQWDKMGIVEFLKRQNKVI